MSSTGKTYSQICEEFKWEDLMASCDWNPSERFNIAHEVCDRHASEPNRVAVFWVGKDGREERITFAELKELSNRFANVLRSLGVQEGDRVACLLPKVPELIITLLATLKAGAVYVPLFTAFGPKALQYRLNHSGAAVLVTNPEYRSKLDEVIGDLPQLKKVVNVDGPGGEGVSKGDASFWGEMSKASGAFQIKERKLDDLAIIQYTSGSTGFPKGAMWSHRVILVTNPYMKYAVDLQPTDMFWGAADPGWAFGLLICLLSPMFMGNSVVFKEAPFTPESCYQVMEKYRVTNFAYAPTAYRALMAAGEDLRNKYKINLRRVSSAGEPLNPEVINWFNRNLGVNIYDHYGLSEMLMIVNNYNATDMPVKIGSMGLPTPGYEVDLLNHEGNPVQQGEVGVIACKTGRPSTAFLGYLNDPEKTKERFIGSWFMTGDMAMRDEDGYFWFQGRDDDIISCAGYRIGPFEIESTLIEHPAVTEAAVIGVPDAMKGEAIKGYVVLGDGFTPSEGLAEELRLFVKNKLAKTQTPKEIEFVTELPKTPSGKIQRFLLRKKNA